MKRSLLMMLLAAILFTVYCVPAFAAPGDNLLTSAVIADCSGQTNVGERPELAIDGSLETKWCCAYSSPTDPSITQYGANLNWITFDLGEAKYFNRYDVAHASLCAKDFGKTEFDTLEWALLVSDDLVNWTEVSHITGNTESMTSHEIALTHARYVRLVVIQGSQDGGVVARIPEVMLYESDETGAMPGALSSQNAIEAEVEAIQQRMAEADAKFQADILMPACIYWTILAALCVVLLALAARMRKRNSGKNSPERALIRSKWIRLIFSAGLCVLAASSLVENYNGTGTLEMFMFFTYLSNLFVVIVFAIQTICCLIEFTGRTARIPSAVKGWVTLSILFTFMTVFFVLSPFSAPGDWLDCRIHYLVPMLTLLEWIVLEPHGKMRVHHPFCWLLTPLVYFGYVLVFCASGVKFLGRDYVPYFFMDMNTYGWPFVLGMTAMLAGIFLVVGFMMFGVDKLIGRKKKV